MWGPLLSLFEPEIAAGRSQPDSLHVVYTGTEGRMSKHAESAE